MKRALIGWCDSSATVPHATCGADVNFMLEDEDLTEWWVPMENYKRAVA